MSIQSLRIRAFAIVSSIAFLAFGSLASADPPSRVARVGYMSGNVSFSPAGENDWVRASINRPLTTGDRLWVDSRARTEVQIGGAVVRMGANTSLSILNLDDRIAQLRLSQGTLIVHVRRLDRNQLFEVATPNLAFTLTRPGQYRISVDPEGYSTDILVRRGQGEAYGDGAAYIIDSRQGYRFTGTNLRDYEYVNFPRPDEFDRWSGNRDRRMDSSASARYVSQDVVGYEDLDANGQWRVDDTYGNVWFPNRVSAGWAPYRDGHWAWVDPWGWTWIDDAPWGFAVSHYGRWANLRGNWGWVPGPVRERAYYAPALVAFVGGNNFQLSISSGNVSGIGWFPLAPREVYRPSYAASRAYFERVNISNTVINNTVINNYYNNSNVTNIVYVNQAVPGAVVAVPTNVFVQSQSVARAAVPVSREMMQSRPVMVVPSAAPTAESVRGAAVQTGAPPPNMFDRAVVARTAPPAAVAGFGAQQQQLNAQPGRPLDAAARREVRPHQAAPAPVVNVVAPAQSAPSIIPPPSMPPGAGASEGRGRSNDRRAPASRGESPVPPAAVAPLQNAAPPTVAPPQFAPPAPPAQPVEQRGKPSEQRGRGEPQRAEPVAPPQSMAPPPVAPAAQRGRAEQQRGQTIGVPPPSPPVPGAVPPTQEPKPVTGKQKDNKKDGDDEKSDDEKRKKKD